MQATSIEPHEPSGIEPSGKLRSSLGRPLVVDVDEVLTGAQPLRGKWRTKAFDWLQPGVRHAANVLGWPWASKSPAHIDQAGGHFDREAVAYLLRIMAEGRPVYLCSYKYDESFVNSTAQRLGVLTAWSAKPGMKHPAEAIADLPSGLRRGFDYLGPQPAEQPDFVAAISTAGPSNRLAAVRRHIRTWSRLLRVHQYAKNALVFLPLLTAHKFALAPAMTALLAAAAFSLCASSGYILNDLVDVNADRAHPTKRNRPIANGEISPRHAAMGLAVMLALAMTLGASVSLTFAGTLLGYLALTISYSFWLKRIAIVDVVTLAILYTVRVVSGAIAIGVFVSEWLFAFSLFMFMSLALVKRYVELNGRYDTNRLLARDYRADDKSMVAILAAASGFNTVVIFTLYISSDAVRALYSHPQILWMICPILMCWIGRTMLLCQRGLIDDDPVIFALRDRFSWLAFGAIGALMLAAI